MLCRRVLPLLLSLVALPAAAQLPQASAEGFGMAGNYAALARGFGAVAWNPALLAAADRPHASFGALTAGGFSGLAPIDLATLGEWSGRSVPAVVRERWLDRIRAAGAQTGRGEVGATLFALSWRNVGVQVGTSAYGVASLSPDAAEAILFGNAGRTGEPRTLDLRRSSLEAGAFTTGALAFGLPVGRRAAVGVTGKYIVGHPMARAADGGSAITPDQIGVDFPMVYSDRVTSGAGVGVDVGATVAGDRWRVGATLLNAVNTFAWDTERLTYRAGALHFDGAASSSDVDERPYADAPASMRDAVESQRFARVASAGVAMAWAPTLTMTADARLRLGEGIDLGPKTHVGVGAEWRGLRVVPLRAGAAAIHGGWQAAAGTGLALGAFELSVSGALRSVDGATQRGVMVGLVSVR